MMNPLETNVMTARTGRGIRHAFLLLVALLAGCAAHTPIQNSVAGLAPAAPVVQIPGYLTGPDGALQKNLDGQCWRTADWRPILAIEECDPALARQNREAELALALSAVAPADISGFDANAAPAPVAENPAADIAVTPPSPSSSPSPPSMPDMVTKPVVLNTDAAFFFGKDRLTPVGRDAVENLAAYIKLWGIEGVQVDITGHSDRIGNARDNLLLSTRRAEAVRKVMVDAGVAADAVVARGVGSTRPITTLEDCPADLVRCDLIGCLAPDRRVEVKLNGTRKSPVR